MGEMSPTHWLIVLGVLVLLFGAKKLPDMARAVGQSARVLKGEMTGRHDDMAQPGQASDPAAPATQPPSHTDPDSSPPPRP